MYKFDISSLELPHRFIIFIQVIKVDECSTRSHESELRRYRGEPAQSGTKTIAMLLYSLDVPVAVAVALGFRLQTNHKNKLEVVWLGGGCVSLTCPIKTMVVLVAGLLNLIRSFIWRQHECITSTIAAAECAHGSFPITNYVSANKKSNDEQYFHFIRQHTKAAKNKRQAFARRASLCGTRKSSIIHLRVHWTWVHCM